MAENVRLDGKRVIEVGNMRLKGKQETEMGNGRLRWAPND